MRLKNATLIFGVLLMAVLAACSPAETAMQEDSMMENQAMQDDSMMEDTAMEEDAMMEDDTMMDSSYTGEVLAGTTTPYLVFNQADYEQALEENKVVLLYFYAKWCPVCRAEQPDIEAAFDQMDYENVVGFRVNYNDADTSDYEESLAAEYQITYQHTKVIIKDGERVVKAPDSWETQRYLDEIAALV